MAAGERVEPLISSLCCSCSRWPRSPAPAREALEHGDAQLAAQSAEQRLVAQRDAARHQARVAAELHDSVGHALTAIIALSEGMQGAGGSPQTDEAIDMMNALAREGLADTRRAVASLQTAPGPSPDDAETTDPLTGRSRRARSPPRAQPAGTGSTTC